MKKWLYKTLVATVALCTFGMITPNHEIWANFEDDRNAKSVLEHNTTNNVSSAYQLDDFIFEKNEQQTIESFIGAAKEQAYVKFGTRVGPVIEDEFETNIFPKIEEAIGATVARLGDDRLRSLAITEKPSGEYAEKIFHIVDNDTRQDIIRFHVRTENRPFDGYYYNFHYHSFEDKYVKHHNLGEIYWSKNTPPKWLS